MIWRKTSLLSICLCLASTLPALAGRMCVTASVANVRSGPGTGYDVLWKVEQYHPLEIVEERGSWYRFVDYAGDRGWVHRSLLGKQNTVITRKRECNIRTGPGTSYAVFQTVGDGIPFRILRKKGRWIQIEHADGDRGWIHDSLVW